jgi:hypothetical protein
VSTGPQPPATTFAWETPRRLAVVLPGFLMLSLLAHTATFLLFRIVYPERVTITSPPPTVSLLDPARPEHQALLRLIEAEDPAPVASVQAVVPPALLDAPYRPSYATVRTLPRVLPEPAPGVQFPPPRDPLAIIRSAAPATPAPAPATTARRTQVAFSGELAARRLVRNPPITFKTRPPAGGQPDLLEPARFLVGVTDRGEVRFVFLQASCGNEAIDQAAANHLTQLSFAPDERAITWAQASFFWGDEVYARDEAIAKSPRPKSP